MIWYTSDTHFGHANIIKHCDRPFKNVQEQDATMIQRWNEVVKPNDTVYHLGDFLLGHASKIREVVRQLNGNIELVLGNHDQPSQIYKANVFRSIQDVILIRDGDTQIFLSHYSHRTWPHQHYGAYHLFGHSHGKLGTFGQSCDVGVDCWNFFPVSLAQIKERLTQPLSLAGALVKHANRTHR